MGWVPPREGNWREIHEPHRLVRGVESLNFGDPPLTLWQEMAAGVLANFKAAWPAKSMIPGNVMMTWDDAMGRARDLWLADQCHAVITKYLKDGDLMYISPDKPGGDIWVTQGGIEFSASQPLTPGLLANITLAIHSGAKDNSDG
jgi:hypothetical protein